VQECTLQRAGSNTSDSTYGQVDASLARSGALGTLAPSLAPSWHLGTWHNGTYVIGNSQSEPYENPDTRIIVHGDYCTIAAHAAAAAAFTLICVSVKLGYAFICYTAVLGYVQYRAYPPTAHTHAQCVRAPRLRCRV
jgi:hypothetical protein